jgi:protein-S-isoprenylcysteine O-methyltransferase Ste14
MKTEGKSIMTVWGIGGKWLFWSLLASAPVIACAAVFRESLVVTAISPWWFYGASIAILLVGIPFWFISAITLKKAYEAETLCTSGVFALCRNPIYAAWILFLVPGFVLFFRNPLLLAIPLVMYAVLRHVLPQEDAWLENKYGEAYRSYRTRVSRILPWPRRQLSATAPAEGNDKSEGGV